MDFGTSAHPYSNLHAIAASALVAYSLFTLAENGYKLVHGMILKNGSAFVYTP